MDFPEKIAEAAKKHLAADVFLSAAPELRQNAIAMAEKDIISLTGKNIDRENVLFHDAVAEQTIFLLLNLKKITSPRNDIVSESVEGAGSVTYSGKTDTLLISPRALQLCSSLLRKNLTLSRG